MFVVCSTSPIRMHVPTVTKYWAIKIRNKILRAKKFQVCAEIYIKRTTKTNDVQSCLEYLQ